MTKMSKIKHAVLLEDFWSYQTVLIEKIKKDKPGFFTDPEPFKGYRLFMLLSFMIHEAVECQQETQWKWWKAKENYKTDPDNIPVEIADMWHVLVQITMEAGLDPHSLFQAFMDKHKENLNRQDRRY